MTSPQSERPPPRRLGLGTVLLIVLLAVIMVGGGLLFWGIRSVADAIPTPGDLTAALKPKPYEEIGPTVVRSIRDLSNLTTIELVEYTIVEKGKDGGLLNWANGDKLQLFAVARIGAGIDLGSVTVRSFDLSDDGVVDLVVPAAEIQYVAVDNEATQILDRETGLFTKGDPRLETDARQVAEDVLRQSALDEGILDKAQANARKVITNFLLNLGYRDVIIDFQ
ncbi:MAG: DUF4230 domain-containing protein [Acidimicrobiia bacterium]